jgi:predicted amidohydrolase
MKHWYGTEQEFAMSRFITVSSLGPSVLRTKPYGQEAVNIMIDHWRNQIEKIIPDKPDLIVIPEVCDRFPAHSLEERKKYYQFRGNAIRDALREIARENTCYITYPAVRVMNDGTCRNSIQLIDRQGNIPFIYNKNYPVIRETEKEGILAGKNAVLFEADFGTLAFAICFDLNFHELLDKYSAMRPDVIIFSSMYHGGLMQNYWAYNCQAYFIGCTAELECTVINPAGTKVAASTNYLQYVTTRINLDYKVIHLDENREKLEKIKKKYGSKVKIFDPGYVGCVLMTSEMDTVTVDDIIKEFQVETWDEYYQRSLRHRYLPGNMEP